MISPISSTYLPSRPAARRPAIEAGGGVEITPDAQVRVTKDVLGFIPVQVSLDIGDILAGKYGRDFRIDYGDNGLARVTAQGQYGPVPIAIDETINLQNGGVLKTLAGHVNDDRSIRVQGAMSLFGWQLPFTCNLVPQRVSQGVFRFNFTSLEVGQGVKLPNAIAAWLTAAVLALKGGLDGVKATDFDQIEVDFAQARVPL